MQQIAEVLKELLDCCSEMLQVSKRQGEALKANDVEQLFGLNEMMTDYAAHLSQLEQERAVLHSAALNKFNLPNKPGLRDFLAGIRGIEGLDHLREQLDLIEGTADELSAAYRALRDQTELNQLMVRSSVAYINKLISILSPEYKLFYKKGGEMYRNRLLSPFVNQTV